MKITLSKNQWERIGQSAGWMEPSKVSQIVNAILDGSDPNYGKSAFHASNIADYRSLSELMEELMTVYDINEQEAASIVSSLTHGDANEYSDPEEDEDIDAPETKITSPIISAERSTSGETLYYCQSATQGEQMIPRALSMAYVFPSESEAQEKINNLIFSKKFQGLVQWEIENKPV